MVDNAPGHSACNLLEQHLLSGGVTNTQLAALIEFACFLMPSHEVITGHILIKLDRTTDGNTIYVYVQGRKEDGNLFGRALEIKRLFDVLYDNYFSIRRRQKRPIVHLGYRAVRIAKKPKGEEEEHRAECNDDGPKPASVQPSEQGENSKNGQRAKNEAFSFRSKHAADDSVKPGRSPVVGETPKIPITLDCRAVSLEISFFRVATVAFHTLGCKLNFAETGTMTRQFREQAYNVVPFGTASDVVVLNTCTVTDEADRKCRQAIRKSLRANPEAFVIVTGCFAQLRPEQVANIDGVDLVLGANEKFNIFGYIDALTKKELTQISVSCIDDVTTYGSAFSASERTRAFLKVQDGCDYTCSFCTIPQARGRSRSDTIEGVLRQAEGIAEAGYREIVLSGVNIGLFGQERGEGLIDLLRALDGVDGIERFRISSCEPNLLSNEIIEFVAGSRSFMPHFHLPLQSGDDFVLGKMRRRYRSELYVDRVARIKQIMPDAAIGVDVIVGFPAETDERFENTLNFLSDLPISYLHVFTYSERPDTTAVDQLEKMGGDIVPKQVRSERNRRLRILSEKKRASFYAQHLGTERTVLWEDVNRDEMMSGFTDNHVRVEARYDAERVGRIDLISLNSISETGNVQSADMTLLPVID